MKKPSRLPRPLAAAVRTLCCTALLVLTACVGSARADVYVTEYVAGAIYRYDANGARSTFATGLNQPIGLAFDAAGNLYEADAASGTIYKFTPAGDQRTVFAANFDRVFGLAFDRAGNLFVAALDRSRNVGSVVKITPGGVGSTFATSLTGPRGLAFDAAGNLYVADSTSGNVLRFTPDGARSTFASGLNVAIGLAFDAAGNLFVGGGRAGVYRITPGGGVSLFTNNVADARYPAFDAAGNLYVTDAGDNSGNPGQGTIQLFTPSGARTTFVANLSQVLGIALTPSAPPATGPVTVSVVGAPARGGFVLSRTGSLDQPVTVFFHNGGSAVRGGDYEAFPDRLTLAAGQSETVLAVNLLPGANRNKKVKVFLDPAGDAYAIGKAQSKVFLSDLP